MIETPTLSILASKNPKIPLRSIQIDITNQNTQTLSLSFKKTPYIKYMLKKLMNMKVTRKITGLISILPKKRQSIPTRIKMAPQRNL